MSVLTTVKSHWQEQKSNYLFAFALFAIGITFHANNSLRNRYEFCVTQLNKTQELLRFQRHYIQALQEETQGSTMALQSLSAAFRQADHNYPLLLENAERWAQLLHQQQQNPALSASLTRDLQLGIKKLNSTLTRYDVEKKRFDTFSNKRWVKALTLNKHYPSLPNLKSEQLNYSSFIIVN